MRHHVSRDARTLFIVAEYFLVIRSLRPPADVSISAAQMISRRQAACALFILYSTYCPARRIASRSHYRVPLFLTAFPPLTRALSTCDVVPADYDPRSYLNCARFKKEAITHLVARRIARRMLSRINSISSLSLLA